MLAELKELIKLNLIKEHWRFLIIVGITIFINIARFSDETYIGKLENLKIACLDDINICNGRYCKYSYSIRSKEYQALFTIQSSINYAIEDREEFKNILSGDTIEIGISKKDLRSLNASANEIPIYMLKKNDQLFFNSNDYLVGQAKQDIRVLILSVLGLTLLSFLFFEKLRKKSYILIFVSIIVTSLILMELKIF